MLPQQEIPVYEKDPSAELLDSIQNRLREINTSESEIAQISSVMEKLLKDNYVVEHLVDIITEEQINTEEYFARHPEIKVTGDNTLTSKDIGRIVRGHFFETYALECIPQEQRPYEELEQFLLWSLKDPRIWFMDWEYTRHLSKDEKMKLKEYFNRRPTKEELDALRNNDAISVQIKKDSETGEETAVITGVVEMKNYALYSAKKASKQMKEAPQILHDTVNRYKDVLPLIMKGLDLGIKYPDKLEILPVDELEYTIVQPSDVKDDYEAKPLTSFTACNFEYVPITREQVGVIGEILQTRVIEALPENSRKKINLIN